MALIKIEIDVTGTAIEGLFRDGLYSGNEFIRLAITNFRPKELDGYENFRSSNYSIGGTDTCIVEAIVRCRRIKN